MKSKIFYTKPSITDLEVSYVTDAVKNGWGTQCYEYITRFEDLFKKYVHTKYAIATSSCTGALHLGLAAIGVQPGDEVILADINWIASAAPIIYLGARPVFVDVLPDTWCIDPISVESAITSRTKAIIAVHLYGNVCEMDQLLEIGKKHNIPIIEDAAEAIGSSWGGKPAGSIGFFGTFSFHGTKTITTGEGGMFVTNDDDLYEKVLTLSNHGRSRGQIKQFWPDIVGFKYKISNVQAAIGCAQVERIYDLIARKREIFEYYARHLINKPGIFMNPEKPGTINGYWMPTVVFSQETGIRREQLQEAFKEEDIDARVFFWPLSSLSIFKGDEKIKNKYKIPERAINLPSYHDITEEEQDRVITVINKVLSE